MLGKNLKIFLDKLSLLPQWIKSIVYSELQCEGIYGKELLSYTPVLTYRGKCELENKNSWLDNNLRNILISASSDCTILDIMLNTYLTMQEVCGYILLCVNSQYIEKPQDEKLLNGIRFFAQAQRIGEYLLNEKLIDDKQLELALRAQEQEPNKRLGQLLVEQCAISSEQINQIFMLKAESKKRIVLDHNDIPEIKQKYANKNDEYEEEIERLRQENLKLKQKLKQLSNMVGK